MDNLLKSNLLKKIQIKKQNELGKVIFVVDNTYYGNILIDTSFKMEMANQSLLNVNSNQGNVKNFKRYSTFYIFIGLTFILILLCQLLNFNIDSNTILNSFVNENYIFEDMNNDEITSVLKTFLNKSQLFNLF